MSDTAIAPLGPQAPPHPKDEPSSQLVINAMRKAGGDRDSACEMLGVERAKLDKIIVRRPELEALRLAVRPLRESLGHLPPDLQQFTIELAKMQAEQPGPLMQAIRGLATVNAMKLGQVVGENMKTLKDPQKATEGMDAEKSAVILRHARMVVLAGSDLIRKTAADTEKVHKGLTTIRQPQLRKPPGFAPKSVKIQSKGPVAMEVRGVSN